MNRVMITKEQLAERIKELGQQITKEYQGKEIVMICLLKGALYFAADLSREIDLSVQLDFLRASSYGSQKVTSGKVNILSDISIDITGKDVLVVDDVLDSGNTLNIIKQRLLDKKPASLKTCLLLVKKATKARGLSGDYEGFVIEDKFVIGYGMDFDEKYRNIPRIEVIDD